MRAYPPTSALLHLMQTFDGSAVADDVDDDDDDDNDDDVDEARCGADDDVASETDAERFSRSVDAFFDCGDGGTPGCVRSDFDERRTTRYRQFQQTQRRRKKRIEAAKKRTGGGGGGGECARRDDRDRAGDDVALCDCTLPTTLNAIEQKQTNKIDKTDRHRHHGRMYRWRRWRRRRSRRTQTRRVRRASDR
jgi:hypothetical protein